MGTVQKGKSYHSLTNPSDNPPDIVPTSKKTKTSPASGQELSHELTNSSIIKINDIDNSHNEQLNKSNPTVNIKVFFSAISHILRQTKMCMKCNIFV